MCADTVCSAQCAPHDNTACQASRSVLFFGISWSTNYHIVVSAWWGYASSADRGQLEAFLRRSVSFGYRDALAPSHAHISSSLRRYIAYNDKHLLRSLLPPERNQHYSLRNLRHSLQLSICTSDLNNNNCLTRMLF